MGIISLFAVSVHGAQLYEILVTDTGTNESGLYGINSYGYASGFRFTNGVSIPWIVTPELGTLDMPALPGAFNNGIAFGIDDDFDVAGNYGTYFGNGLNLFHINNGIGCVWHWDG